MISTKELTLSFTGTPLFEDVTVKFTEGNCYGLIGANGAGKSTFLKILSGDIEPTKGQVIIDDGKRLAVLKQDQFAFDEYKALATVIMGHKELYDVYAERDALYSKAEMSDEEGMRAGELEVLFGEMDGYNAEADASTLLSQLGLSEEEQDKTMKELDPSQKIRVLLAQALFGNPDILLLDEPTNQLDLGTVLWLEKFLLNFKNTVIVVSHDRHFLNKVCTHTADLDYKQVKIYAGNYDFWQQSSELARKQQQDQQKKSADKIKELEEFIRRFSANVSKSKQATSRKKMIDKLKVEDLPTSSRKSPFIQFKAKRPVGGKILIVENISHSINGEQVLNKVSFTVEKGDKIVLMGKNSISKTTLLQILAGEITPDEGSITWGDSVTSAYFPKDNSEYFNEGKQLMDWLSQFTNSNDDQFIRGFLGRMLFSGDDVKKPVNVLSGGEKARAMFSKMMLSEANFLVFDEPTDHLDLESITSLNKGLKEFNDILLFTSHDMELMTTVCNRILEVTPKGTLDRRMDVEEYLEKESIAQLRAELY